MISNKDGSISASEALVNFAYSERHTGGQGEPVQRATAVLGHGMCGLHLLAAIA